MRTAPPVDAFFGVFVEGEVSSTLFYSAILIRALYMLIILINIVIIIEEGARIETLGAVTTCQMLCQAPLVHITAC